MTDDKEMTATATASQYVLYFDTEVIDFCGIQYKSRNLPCWKYFKYPLITLPYLTQLSFILFNPVTYEVVDFYSAYVEPDARLLEQFDYKIDQLLIKNDGSKYDNAQKKYKEGLIKRKENSVEHGRPIMEILYRFYGAYKQASRIIAHNLSYDRAILKIEIERHLEELSAHCPELRDCFDSVAHPTIKDYCTMKKTTDYCNLPMNYNSKYPNSTKLKWPKLQELYKKLFNEDAPQPAHNAVVDALVGLRCYLKYVEDKTIHSAKFIRMIKRGMEMAHIDKKDYVKLNYVCLP